MKSLVLGGNVENLGQIDGVDQWMSLINTLKPIRSTILINIDETRGEEALIFDRWKVVKSKMISMDHRNILYISDIIMIEFCDLYYIKNYTKYLINLSWKYFISIKQHKLSTK